MDWKRGDFLDIEDINREITPEEEAQWQAKLAKDRAEHQREAELITPALHHALSEFEWYFDEKGRLPYVAAERWSNWAASDEDAEKMTESIKRICRLAGLGYEDTGSVIGGALFAIFDLVLENHRLKVKLGLIPPTSSEHCEEPA